MAVRRTKRSRMILGILPEIQLAIRLRAIKNSVTTGEVVSEAVGRAYPREIEEARAVLAERASTEKQQRGVSS